MQPTIQKIADKKLVGKRIQTTIAENRTFELWNGFMRRRKEILNPVSSNLFSVQIYDTTTNYQNFTIHTLYEKWAAVEVSDFDNIPSEMDIYILKGGDYAVFEYKGTPEKFPILLQYIFEKWFPNSEYVLDNTRPQFEILGEKYKYNHPDSEEDVWIPIKEKTSA